MFNKVRAGIQNTRSKVFNSIGSSASEVGPLSFFTQWFNPNNLVGELQQLEKYTGITYACVSAIAEDVAKIKFTMNRTRKDGTLEPVNDHPFLQLLKNPNPTQSDYEFMEMTQTHIELTGEAFWYVPKGAQTAKPKELWIMRPDLVQVVYDQESGEVTGYIYHKFNGRVEIPLDLDEVIHFKMPNPINPYRGMGTVQAGIVYIQTEEFASRFSRNFLANNATPAGIVNFKGTIGDPEFQKVKRQWTREYGNVENAGKTAFVRSADVSYQKIGSSLQDIDLAALKNLTRDDIMFMFRVSKPILGITDEVNYSNAQTAEYIFAKRVIDPKMNRIVDTLQTFYNSKYKDSYLVSYVTPIPQNNDEKIAYYNAAINKWMTPDEVREKEGLDAIDGGDKIRMPFNLVSIDANITPVSSADGAATAITEEPTSSETKATHKKRYVLKTAKKKAVKVEPSGLNPTKENFRLLIVATANAYRPQIKHQIAQAMAKQRSSVLSQLKVTKSKAAQDTYGFSTTQSTQDIVDSLVPTLSALTLEAGGYASQLAGGPAFSLTAGTIPRLTNRIQTVASAYTERIQASLIETIQNGLAQGLTLTELSSEVSTVMSDAQGWQAERIARTETMHEANMATMDAYEQSGVLEKEWYAGGADPCQYCEELNGTIVGTQDVFIPMGESIDGVNGGSFLADYQDVEAGDLHPNCECTIIPGNVELTDAPTMDATSAIDEQQVATDAQNLVDAVAQDNTAFQDNLDNLASQLETEAKHGTPKTADRIAEKAISDYNGQVSQVQDAVRGTLKLQNPADMNSYVSAIKEQYPVTRIKDTLDAPYYQQVIINITLPSGYTGEIQLVTPEMLTAKGQLGGHALYKATRVPGLSAEEQAAKIDQMNQLYIDAQQATADRLAQS